MPIRDDDEFFWGELTEEDLMPISYAESPYWGQSLYATPRVEGAEPKPKPKKKAKRKKAKKETPR